MGAELAVGSSGQVAELVEAVGEVLDDGARGGLAGDRGQPATLLVIGLDGGDTVAKLVLGDVAPGIVGLGRLLDGPVELNALSPKFPVKINFPNRYAVYLHDTPTRELFGRNARYLSSGCIRVDRVDVLVDWILSGQDGFDANMIETIAATGRRLDKPVRNGPDLRIMYLTAWATEDGRIHFRPDVYRLDHTGFVTGQPQPRSDY
ncbi:MAG: L,D-transpeptidase family protein [Parvibaculaceae bacterium]